MHDFFGRFFRLYAVEMTKWVFITKYLDLYISKKEIFAKLELEKFLYILYF